MLGRWYSILAIAIAVAISSALCGASPLPIATLLGSQLLAQGVVELLKRSFRRVRPDYWLVRQERDLSYPSGHATTAIVFFVPLVALVSVGHVVPQIAAVPVACALALCVFGIPWSRLVLGAHYPTDVAGGVLFGTGWLAASLAVLGSR
jgi:undecaprenyl-diphosphatase